MRHAGRRSGTIYETPVVAVAYEDGFLIALPYGMRTDWLKNVLAGGKAEVLSEGTTYAVDRPEVIAMSEATAHFRIKEQRLHRRFRVESALRVERAA